MRRGGVCGAFLTGNSSARPVKTAAVSARCVARWGASSRVLPAAFMAAAPEREKSVAEKPVNNLPGKSMRRGGVCGTAVAVARQCPHCDVLGTE